jgi:hypothetical protein
MKASPRAKAEEELEWKIKHVRSRYEEAQVKKKIDQIKIDAKIKENINNMKINSKPGYFMINDNGRH